MSNILQSAFNTFRFNLAFIPKYSNPFEQLPVFISEKSGFGCLFWPISFQLAKFAAIFTLKAANKRQFRHFSNSCSHWWLIGQTAGNFHLFLSIYKYVAIFRWLLLPSPVDLTVRNGQECVVVLHAKRPLANLRPSLCTSFSLAAHTTPMLRHWNHETNEKVDAADQTLSRKHINESIAANERAIEQINATVNPWPLNDRPEANKTFGKQKRKNRLLDNICYDWPFGSSHPQSTETDLHSAHSCRTPIEAYRNVIHKNQISAARKRFPPFSERTN